MSAGRIGALARRIVLQLRRDHRTLGLMLGVPLVVLWLLSYLIGLSPGQVPLGIVNLDRGSLAGQVIQELNKVPAFQGRELSEEEATAQVRRGEIKAVLTFPSEFTQGIASQHLVVVNLKLEGSNPQLSSFIATALRQRLAPLLSSLGGLSSGDPAVWEVSYVYGGENFAALDYLAPASLSLFAFLFVFILTSVSFLRERTQGTMERLMASPITRVEIVLGYMLGFGFFALLQSTLILLFAILVLKIHYVGNPLLVFVIISVLTLGAVNLGIFLSAFARNELQAVQFLPVVLFPQVLLGGIFWRIEDMHLLFQGLAHLFPLTYANMALREVMIKGYNLANASVAVDILALALFAAAMVLCAAVTLRRE